MDKPSAIKNLSTLAETYEKDIFYILAGWIRTLVVPVINAIGSPRNPILL